MIFDHLNHLVLERIAKRNQSTHLGAALGTVSVTDQGLKVTSEGSAAYTLVWTDVTQVAALKVPQYVGNTLMLVFEFQGGHSLTLTEDMAGWTEVSRDLPVYLPGALPYEDWALGAAFDNDRNEPVWIYRLS